MNSQFYNRLMIGIILVGIGVLFLLDQLGIVTDISFGYIFSTFWPVIIIVFALKGVFFQKRLRYGWIGSYIWNLVALGIGIYFLGSNLGYIDFSIGDLIRFILPIGLILFGISMLFHPAASKRPLKDRCKKNKEPEVDDDHVDYTPPDDYMEWGKNNVLDSKFPVNDHSLNTEETKEEIHDLPPIGSNDDWRKTEKEQKQHWKEQHKQHWKEQKQHWKEQKHYWKHQKHDWHDEGYYSDRQDVEYRSGFIGDMYLGQDDWELKPMNISHFIGDTKIDLTKASIPYGETRLQISAFIGDVKIYVPDDIDLKVRVTSSVFIGELNVMERYESGFAKSMKSESPQYSDAEKKLRVDVSLFLGDVVVKKVG